METMHHCALCNARVEFIETAKKNTLIVAVGTVDFIIDPSADPSGSDFFYIPEEGKVTVGHMLNEPREGSRKGRRIVNYSPAAAKALKVYDDLRRAVESGARKPPSDIIPHLAKVLECEIAELYEIK